MKIVLLSDKTIFNNDLNLRGTENIVKIIYNEIQSKGFDVKVLFPEDNRKIITSDEDDIINFYSRGRLLDNSSFKETLKEIKPDLVQFHGFSTVWGFSHLLACKELNIKTFLWHNVPFITCMQHSLLYMSKEPCDGKFSLQKCTSCRLNLSIKSEIISNIFGAIENFPIYDFNSKRLNSLLKARNYSYEFYNSIKLMANNFDFVRYGAEWVQKVLLINNFDKDKLFFIRPSISNKFWNLYSETKNTIKEKDLNNRKNIQFLFWGRLVNAKGLNVIRKAIRKLKRYKYTLHIVGDIKSGDQSFIELYSENKNNNKVIFHDGLDQTSIFKLGSQSDLAVIPSSWFETGPITVYEAFAMQLPIIGTRLGGIEELCLHNYNSLLFELNNHNELAKLMISLIKEPQKIDFLRSNLPKPRSPKDLSEDLINVYCKHIK